MRRRGLTLLELLLILGIIAAIVFIALPTLKPSQQEAAVDFTKEQLLYLAGREQEYFLRNGTYAPLSKIAADPALGAEFDQRFAKDESEVNGIKFTGPTSEGMTFDIVAALPDGTRYKVDQSGAVVPLQ